ncbi:related to multidrug resistance protein fnx1 [Rhynchosporium secalis]|uniref:Related to multidrug resistance protein fnx1 n=1 Tax=Rhynchosporium secalis TaxID=38038 RepID=A0A1E1M8F7_RHYSE|nr:related to multidrug resistance protein fnx1 [Rhynchosporium secalis]
MGGQNVHGESSKNHQYEVNEHTLLLPGNDQRISKHGTISSNDTLTDEDTDGGEIDPNEFDNLLSRSQSITSGLGIEPESQQKAMLRGPRRYSSVITGSQAPGYSGTLRRKRSQASVIGSTHSTIQETIESESDENSEPKSPFLAGVSVSTFWLIFGGILSAQFVACFDSTIMVSSHPVITSYFHSSNSASWLSTAFLLTSTSFQPLFGRLSDTIGRKPPYIFSMTLFLLATIWCALAQSMTSFILARAVCGLGAGGMMSMGAIITSDLVPIEIRGAYQSYMNLVYGAGSALGAALGGAISDNLGWRWEFGIQVPLLAVGLCIAHVTVPRKLGLAEGVEKTTIWEAMKVFDYQGSILLTTSITFLILGVNLGGNIYPWSHPFIITSLTIFAVCFPAFLYIESRVALPIMPLDLLTRFPRAGLILSNFLGAIIMNAVLFNIPLYFQAVLLESATSSGLRLIVPSLASSSVGTATGFLITYTKRLKIWLVLGVVFLVIGTVELSFMRRDLPDWAYLLYLVPQSVGQGFMFPTTFMTVLAVSKQADQAVVTSTLILWRSIGSVLGVAMSSLVLQNALLSYLGEFVVGPDKEYVIQKVRKSVLAIANLDPIYREQVIDAYAASLRATFIMAAVLSVVAFCMVIPLKIPRLGQRK